MKCVTPPNLMMVATLFTRSMHHFNTSFNWICVEVGYIKSLPSYFLRQSVCDHIIRRSVQQWIKAKTQGQIVSCKKERAKKEVKVILSSFFYFYGSWKRSLVVRKALTVVVCQERAATRRALWKGARGEVSEPQFRQLRQILGIERVIEKQNFAAMQCDRCWYFTDKLSDSSR